MHYRTAAEPRSRVLQFLAAISTIASADGAVDKSLAKALGEICVFTGSPVGHAFAVSPAGAEPTRVWHVDDPRRFAAFRTASESISFVAGQGLIGQVLGSRAPSWLEDVSRDETFLRSGPAEAVGLRCAFAFPVFAGSEVAAVLEFYDTEPCERDDELLALMQVVGLQLGSLIERARAAERLSLEHTRQRLLFESSTDALFVAGPTGLIADMNPAACRLLGYTLDELIGMRPSDLVAPEWTDFVERSMEAKFGNEKASSRYELVVVDRFGDRIPVEVTSTALRDGELTLGVHALMRDLRERRSSERALRESEERFRSAFESAPIGMGLTSLDGRWLKVNDALCRLIGYSASELLTMCFQEVTHPDDLEADIAFGKRMLAGEIPSYQMEKRYICKDGSLVWVLLSISLVRDANGAPAYSVAQILDIDDRIKHRNGEAPELRSVRSAPGPLSPRERQILVLLAEGKTSAEAGADLGVSEETVQTHVRRSMAKLDARSRTQAVAAAIRHGWLDDDTAAVA